MAYIKMNVFSRSLMRTAPVTVVLPLDRFPFPGVPERPEKPFKTLYLLHGGFGGPNDFMYYTNVKKYAEAHDLALVIPGGDNLFFTDQPQFHANLGSFAGDELVRLTRRMFPLSEKREDTFLAGCSMGGYAALKLGLKYGEHFGYTAAFSAPTIMDALKKGDERKLPEMIGGRKFIEAVFGDPDRFAGSEHDLAWYAAQRKEAGAPVPKLYLSAGESEFLSEDCERLGGQLKEDGYDVTLRIPAGGHDWSFWDRELDHIIRHWLPVEPDIFRTNPD